MIDNLSIWNALAKTDPKHTKGFNRAGGFKGTAVKPIWIIKRLTEQFGPCGIGWGVNAPQFQVVPCEREILVYCTVSVWHGTRDNVLFGVGGDKVQAGRKESVFCDDEAFKKAFTDAVNNAFKFIGVGADVHMGQFDDDKYVTQMRQEFEQQEAANDGSLQLALDGIAGCETQIALKEWWERNSGGIPDHHYETVLAAAKDRKAAIKQMDRAAA
jgi:hypothetical protein